MAAQSRYGSIADDRVIIDCWLVIDAGDPANWNRRPSARLSAGQPKLDRRERAINLKMSLPLALFETPAIVARIEVDDPAMPVTIDTAAVADAVKSAIGLDIDLRVVPPAGGGA
ncbi:hypothetical protein [Sphingobium yanoikuyae]|uniref:hypothetical protein n=1 Tax=Sphingobium yanoikuyae TaxID=13690 RepID=UPI0028AFE730|nr:hypothetical protein [Sphingobium yanoikuyae]